MQWLSEESQVDRQVPVTDFYSRSAGRLLMVLYVVTVWPNKWLNYGGFHKKARSENVVSAC